MSIDATKSPTPAWQRKAVAVLLALLVTVVGYTLWSKDFHHQAAAPPAPPPAAKAPVRSVPSTTAVTAPSTTIPGGLPLSGRDPFASQ